MSKLDNIVKTVQPLFPEPPAIAVVLGSGLGTFAEELESPRKIATSEIAGYPRSTVAGHDGFIISGSLAGKRAICFQGRIHLYEGYEVDEVVLPIQLASALGAKTLIITNASGGVNDALAPGSLMLITDQINFQFRRRVLPSENQPTIERPTWYSGTGPYSPPLQTLALEAASDEKIRLFPGRLGAVLGPTYETPAEVRMLRFLGADSTSMSTVAEAAEAARLGMEVLGISCITNKAAGLPGSTLDHEDVIAVAARVKDDFIRLLKSIIQRIK
ncbi:purine-nucleoside phosphorylase [bacterium]|nr:purine-nucleoside phosphorylase [bacterium]MBU1651908.1 purine-nucleoside phosphorylase [bacterium]